MNDCHPIVDQTGQSRIVRLMGQQNSLSHRLLGQTFAVEHPGCRPFDGVRIGMLLYDGERGLEVRLVFAGEKGELLRFRQTG